MAEKEFKSTLTEIDAYKRDLLVEVPAPVVAKEIEAVSSEIIKGAKVPGFRPGKAPLSVIKQRYKASIEKRIIDKLIPEYYRLSVEKHKLNPLHSPYIEEVLIKEGQPLKFKATFEIVPEIEVKDYDKVKVKKEKVELTGKDAEERFNKVIAEHAELIPVDDRGIKVGDLVKLDYRREIAGEKTKPLFQQDTTFEVGSQVMPPPFSEALIGLRPGEEKEFTFRYPGDYRIRELSGKEAAVRVVVKEIKEKKLPEPDDEFAKDLGFDNLTELKKKLEATLLVEKEQEAEQKAIEEIFAKIIKKNPFPVPEYLVIKELDSRVEEVARSLSAQGVDPRGVNWKRFRDEERDNAALAVRKGFILDFIIDKEGLVASDEEVEKEIEKLAEGSGHSAQSLKARLTKDKRIPEVKRNILMRKAIDFLKKNAIIN
jgi:trigger factor